MHRKKVGNNMTWRIDTEYTKTTNCFSRRVEKS
jgi:hypothetical protein